MKNPRLTEDLICFACVLLVLGYATGVFFSALGKEETKPQVCRSEFGQRIECPS